MLRDCGVGVRGSGIVLRCGRSWCERELRRLGVIVVVAMRSSAVNISGFGRRDHGGENADERSGMCLLRKYKGKSSL